MKNIITGIVERKNNDLFFRDENNTYYYKFNPKDSRKLLGGEKVKVELQNKNSHKKITLIDISSYKKKKILCRVLNKNGKLFFKPFNIRGKKNFFLDPASKIKFKTGDIISIKTDTCKDKNYILITIEKNFGAIRDLEVQYELILEKFDIFEKLKKRDQLNKTSFTEDFETSKIKRVDLQRLYFVTIDPKNAKDLDDAVYCEKNKNGNFRLFVSIADVSNYVLPKDENDIIAREIGSSIYLYNKVIPMLPNLLSSNICSLLPNVKRKVINCEINISKDGKIEDYSIYPAIIISKKKFSYENFEKYLSGTQIENNCIFEILKNLKELYDVLALKKNERGGLNFESKKIIYELKDDKYVKSIKLDSLKTSHKIIEECMIVANVCAADYLSKDRSFLYRVHEKPSDYDVINLKKAINKQTNSYEDVKFDSSEDYMNFLNSIKKNKVLNFLSYELLKTLPRACYSKKNIGHFGLSLKMYTHFTSPIRRYSDLLIHRAIKYKLEKKKYFPDLEWEKMAVFCNEGEIVSEKAERDMEKWLKCSYMQRKVGIVYSGLITSIMDYGFYVLIEKYPIDGFVHISKLGNKYFLYNELDNIIVSDDGSYKYEIGNKINVIVESIDMDRLRINFKLKV